MNINLQDKLGAILNDKAIEAVQTSSDITELNGKFTIWLDKIVRFGASISDLKDLTKHTRSIFEAKYKTTNASQWTPVATKLHATLAKEIENRQKNLEAIAKLNFGQRVENGSIAIGTLENMATALSKVKMDAIKKPDGEGTPSHDEQRETLGRLTFGLLAQHADNPEKFTEALTGEIEKSGDRYFTREGIEKLKQEGLNQVILSKATETASHQLNAFAIALAGPEGINKNKPHPLHYLAQADLIKTDLDIATLKPDQLEGYCNSATQKLTQFWKDQETLGLLARHGVVPSKDGVIDLSKLSDAGKDDLVHHMAKYINVTGKFGDEEKAVTKELCKKSALLQQADFKFDFRAIFEKLTGGGGIGKLLSSGIFGVIAAGLGGPWMGIIVALVSGFLNNDSGNEGEKTATTTATTTAGAKKAPPAPTQTSSPVAA